MRISDWSSDVCSSDLPATRPPERPERSWRAPPTTGSEGSSPLFPPEQLLDVTMPQLHPGRTAVVALAGVGRDFHLAQQGVHFGDRQQTPRPHRAVTTHGGGDMIEAFLKGERFVIGGELVGEVGDEALDVALAEDR